VKYVVSDHAIKVVIIERQAVEYIGNVLLAAVEYVEVNPTLWLHIGASEVEHLRHRGS
jgi:hypothetical protein